VCDVISRCADKAAGVVLVEIRWTQGDSMDSEHAYGLDNSISGSWSIYLCTSAYSSCTPPHVTSAVPKTAANSNHHQSLLAP
jgi:hypothetical protein